ncbi:unnamed protein product [Trifolium pratense]|uniref:Uncharacterized protein n=1 Tax=Trifolium pratense TaxID=57577 RepID=A0ACB0L422_TRIPR|nr:unnamed protein product [Trifolium pratense]
MLIATETLDDNQPSLPEKLDDPAYKSKPKETEVVVEQDASVEVDESKYEKEEIDEHDDSEKEDQTDVESKMVETTIDEEGVLNLELEGSFNENNNNMDYDIQTEATPEIDKETKEKEGHVTNLSSSATRYDATSRTTQTEELMNIDRGKTASLLYHSNLQQSRFSRLIQGTKHLFSTYINSTAFLASSLIHWLLKDQLVSGFSFFY